MKRTNYMLSEDQHETLKEEAKRRGCSVSEMLRRIVDEWNSAKLVLVGMELISVERIDIDSDRECVGTVPAQVVRRQDSNGRTISKIPGIRIPGPFHGFHVVFGDLYKRICVLAKEEQVLEIDLDDGKHGFSKDWEVEYFDPADIRAATVKRQQWESIRDKKFW